MRATHHRHNIDDTRGRPDIGFLDRCVSAPRDRDEARELFVRIWNRDGTTEQAQQWLARLKNLAPRYFESHPGAYLQVRVDARPVYDTLRAQLGPHPSKEQLVTLVSAIQDELRRPMQPMQDEQRREQTSLADEAALWILYESIPRLQVRYWPADKVPGGRSAVDMVEEALAGHPLIFEL